MTNGADINDLDQARYEFGRLLGLSKPVSEKVFNAALSNDSYANNLITCKDTAPFLNHLLNNPPEVDADDQDNGIKTPELSNSVLLTNAAKALYRWGQNGFKTVDESVYAKRMDLCRHCPHFVAPPSKMIYQLISTGISEADKICSLCGCVVSRKAKLASERCPATSEENSTFTRWGELVVPALN